MREWKTNQASRSVLQTTSGNIHLNKDKETEEFKGVEDTNKPKGNLSNVIVANFRAHLDSTNNKTE
jgi:hypothetical protein